MIIKRINANDPRFKGNSVEFQPGLNVILADRHSETEPTAPNDRKTVNGAGKTSLLEIIHYCLGKDVVRDRGSVFHQEALRDWEFSLTLEDNGSQATLTRSVLDKNVINVACSSDLSGFPPMPKTGEMRLSRQFFTDSAVEWMFDLPSEVSVPYHPKFRSLISYLIRVGKDAYLGPFSNNRKQSEWDSQACAAYFLGLNPNFAGVWQVLREKEKRLKALKQLAKSDTGSGRSVTKAALWTKVVRLREQVEQEEQRLREFKVHEQYTELEQRASKLTETIHRLMDDNIVDQQLIGMYEAAQEDETQGNIEDVEHVYRQVGIYFPEQVRRRLEDVKAFHRTILTNRRSFVRTEITRLRDAVKRRRDEIERLTNERADLLSILEEHGALQDLVNLQRLHSETIAALREAEKEHEAKVELDDGNTALRRERADLLVRAEMDRKEREAILEQAILLFNQNSQVLYPHGGDLLIDITETGYRFDIDIPRDRSDGIGNMKIFLYDLMLMQLPRNHRFPRFLVHDSVIFDGVDGRQRAAAIELAARESKRLGFQYIFAINRDDVPWQDFTPEFAAEFNTAIRLELSDLEKGGLFGFELAGPK